MVNADLVFRYFPSLSAEQQSLFSRLGEIYAEQNAKVNLISRKDFDNFYIHHVLHSLALVKFCEFESGKSVVDIGTGGGFPGIPLAIMFPEVKFTLVDSIGKKIRAVQEVADLLTLSNVTAVNNRTEQLNHSFDIAVARAVAPMIQLWSWMDGQWKHRPVFYLLKGGDLSEEMNELLTQYRGVKIKQKAISEVFSEPFFETKKVLTLLG